MELTSQQEPTASKEEENSRANRKISEINPWKSRGRIWKWIGTKSFFFYIWFQSASLMHLDRGSRKNYHQVRFYPFLFFCLFLLRIHLSTWIFIKIIFYSWIFSSSELNFNTFFSSHRSGPVFIVFYFIFPENFKGFSSFACFLYLLSFCSLARALSIRIKFLLYVKWVIGGKEVLFRGTRF